jgi:hypothetical protein
MKLTQLAAKPQLIKMELDDEETVKEFGESLEFWIWDRQPIDKFIKLATLKADDLGQLIDAVNGMVLDEAGLPVLKDGETLPTHVMTRLIGKVVETLGK